MILFLYFIETVKSNPYSKFDPQKRMVFNNDCHEIIINFCSFYNINTQDEEILDGGAIFVMLDASIIINKCIFDNCIAERSGGAMYISRNYSDYNSYFINDGPVNYSEIKYCCFQECFCRNNARSCSVIVISSYTINFQYSNTQKCPGYKLLMETSQICILPYLYETIKYLNLSQGNSKFGSGIEFFYGNQFAMEFNTFTQMKGSFVTYFNYFKDKIGINLSNYINNTIIDDFYAENTKFTPALIYNFMSDICLNDCTFSQIFYYKKSIFAYANNYVYMTNCYSDKIGDFHGYTYNCNFSVPVDEIQTIQIDHYDCAVFYFTAGFTESSMFTKSSQFSHTEIFTQSHQFSQSNEFITDFPSGVITTYSYMASFVLRKSVSFHASYSNSYTLVLMFINNTYLYDYSLVASMYYFPMIIQYYSISYVPVAFIQEELIIKKKINGSQIIGIVCGASALLFIIAYLIIIIHRKTTLSFNINDQNNDISDSSEIQETKNITVETEVAIPDIIKIQESKYDGDDEWL